MPSNTPSSGPSVNPGNVNAYIQSAVIGGGQIVSDLLPLASSVAPGTPAYQVGIGPIYSDGSVWQQFGGGSSGGIYNVSISATLASGNTDSFAPTGYVAGVTNRLRLTPNAAGSTLLGLLAATDGWSILLVNLSLTVPIIISNQASGTSANQFRCPNYTGFSIAPGAAKLLFYDVNQWTMTT